MFGNSNEGGKEAPDDHYPNMDPDSYDSYSLLLGLQLRFHVYPAHLETVFLNTHSRNTRIA